MSNQNKELEKIALQMKELKKAYELMRLKMNEDFDFKFIAKLLEQKVVILDKK